MIQVENLSYSFPEKELYKNISFTLEDGQHCALIGRNGTGKTTLIDMIMDTEKYLYDGKIIKDEYCRIGYVSQFAKRDKSQDITVFEFLSEKFIENQEKTATICEKMAVAEDMEPLFEAYQKLLDEFQAMDGDNYESNIHKQLKTAGLNSHENMLISQLSGGEYKLLQVMKAMLLQPNLLIMDEPDVFLDFENLAGLCKLIHSYKGTLLVITHNRYLLNHCFHKILHLENADIQEFDGNYTDYNFALLQKKIELKEQAIGEQEEIRRNEEMVERMRTTATNMSIASLGRTVHARQTHLDRLRARQIKEPFVDIHEPEIVLPEVEGDAEKTILSVQNYELAFDEELLTDVNFEIKGNEKVAIVGPNGTGKSTLLQEIYEKSNAANNNPADSKPVNGNLADGNSADGNLIGHRFAGSNTTVVIGENVKAGFLEQIQGEKLSGGEQNLLQLAKLSESEADLLLLDEPASHLDTYAQIALEKAIAEYKGAVLMVSHDFYNIVNCADYVLLVEDKSIRRMRIRAFRKMIYEKYFDKDYLEIEQKKKELEMRIAAALKNSDMKTAKNLCEQLGEVVERLQKKE